MTSSAVAAGPVVLDLSYASFFQDTSANCDDNTSITVYLTSAASKTATVPGTFTDSVLTDANGTVTVTYQCLTLAPDFSCVSKTPKSTTISTPNTTVTFHGSFTNTGTENLTDLIITDNMTAGSPKMVIVASPDLGMPTETPPGSGHWVFPGTSLAIGATLNFQFDVQITGLVKDEQVCDQLIGHAAGLTRNGAACNACVTYREQGKVPAMNTVGLVALLGVVAVSGVLLLRRRQRA